MKIKYEFVTGDTVQIKVSDEWGHIIIDMNREDYNEEKKETRRHYKLDTSKEGSGCLADDDESVEDIAVDDVVAEGMAYRIKRCLTARQFDAFWKVCVEGYTEREYADVSNMSHQAVDQLVQAARKKLQNIF